MPAAIQVASRAAPTFPMPVVPVISVMPLAVASAQPVRQRKIDQRPGTPSQAHRAVAGTVENEEVVSEAEAVTSPDVKSMYTPSVSTGSLPCVSVEVNAAS